MLEVTAGDVRVEQVQRVIPYVNEVVRQTPLSREDIERDALQEFVGVFRRGGCCQREAESVGKGVKLTGLDQLDHLLLLALAIGLGAIRGVGYLEIRQRHSSSAQTRLVGHHLLVHLGCEALKAVGGLVANVAPVGIHKLAQGVPPGALVRRANQNPSTSKIAPRKPIGPALFHLAVCHARGPGFSLHPLASSTIHDMCYFSNKSIAKSMNTVKQSGCVVDIWR